MPSSTSSSEQQVQDRRTHRSIWAIVIGLVLIFLSSEIVTVVGIHHVSKIMRRTTQEYHDSEKLQSYSISGKPTMLLFGNSLLLEGVDYPALRNALSAQYDVHRLIFEQTEYLDLYYVLRRLFRHGARPHDVVLCISASQIIADTARGDFMSRYLDEIDIVNLGRRQHLDATTLSSLMLAHWSEWFAFRAETRNALLGLVMPDMRDLATAFGRRRAPRVDPEEVRLKTEPRLRELKDLCDQYGSRLTIVVPPSPRQNNDPVLASAGNSAGIRTLIPEEPGAMDFSFFRDGFHLNPTGAAVFTAKLQSQLAIPAH